MFENTKYYPNLVFGNTKICDILMFENTKRRNMRPKIILQAGSKMKFCDKPFSVTKSYLAKMEQRREYFAEATSATKALHLTMIAPYGISHTHQRLQLRSVINSAHLFTTVKKHYVKLSAASIAEAAP